MRGGLHERRTARVYLEWAEDVRTVRSAHRADRKAAGETRPLAEALVGDLVADRAGHPVERELGGRCSGRHGGEVGEDDALLSVLLGEVARHRHVARGALVFDFGLGIRVVHHFAAHGGLPVGVAGGVRHHRGAPVAAERDVLAGRRHDAVVTPHAGRGGRELDARGVGWSRDRGSRARRERRSRRCVGGAPRQEDEEGGEEEQ